MVKQTILALAVASLSFAAYAVPPGPPSSGPVDVKIVSPVPLPVTEVPSWTAPERMYFASTGGGVVGVATGKIPLDTDAVLQSYDAQVHVETGDFVTCTANASIVRQDDSVVAELGRVVALGGRDSALSVRLPNTYVEANQNLYLSVAINSTGNVLCFFDVQIRGVKVP